MIVTFVIPTGILALATILLIYESPFFIYQTDTNAALNILNKIAMVNKKPLLGSNTLSPA